MHNVNMNGGIKVRIFRFLPYYIHTLILYVIVLHTMRRVCTKHIIMR